MKQRRPLINNPTPLNGDYNSVPNTKALERRGLVNHGSTLVDWGLRGKP